MTLGVVDGTFVMFWELQTFYLFIVELILLGPILPRALCFIESVDHCFDIAALRAVEFRSKDHKSDYV